MRSCYCDSVANFLKMTEDEWLEEMKNNFDNVYATYYLEDAQIKAWRDSFRVMQNSLSGAEYPATTQIIFEYRLPYEGGRRPDVILLSADKILVLEFKMAEKVKQSYLDQVKSYGRDLKLYHFSSRDKKIIKVLVLTRANNLRAKINGVYIRSGDNLSFKCNCSEKVDWESWINSRYEPLPTIVDAARSFFENKELPQIKHAQSNGINDAFSCLDSAAKFARDNQRYILALVTGVPGAGKTYLGLEFVNNSITSNSLYASGNGPLVEVLQKALKNDFSIKGIRKVIEEYVRYGAQDFNRNLVVFDEGQRAWDEDHMSEKWQFAKNLGSESDILVDMLQKRLPWCVLLVLVGEGQSINKGEYGGIPQWSKAIEGLPWDVLCPPRLDPYFTGSNILNARNRGALDLTASLRTHLALDYSNFVNALLDDNIPLAKELLSKSYSQYYDIFVTRDIELAKEYCRERYSHEDKKRCGILVSSKANSAELKKYKINNSYDATRNVDFDCWYNRPMGQPGAGGSFESVVTEFGCQGLELDMPIVCWGSDFVRKLGKWKFDVYIKSGSGMTPVEEKKARIEADQARKDSYRVFLTRGRDGVIIFVPNEAKYNETFNFLINLGVKELKGELDENG